jgi:isoleucyl-tRNA synthetase
MLDEWIIARLDETTLAVREALDVYDAERATQHCESLLDDLSNWYVRRSRRRFWRSETDADKGAAYATLYHVLVEFAKLLAPFIPFTTEVMYQNLVRRVNPSAPESVHHCLYPQASAEALDQRLLDKMRLAITTASLGRAARSSADVKLRQPLATARVGGLAVASEKGVTVAIDPHLTSDLVQEGYARDIVRTINNMRKEAGLDVSDRIRLAYRLETNLNGEMAATFKNFADYIRQETLTIEMNHGELDKADIYRTVDVGDESVVLALQRADE